MGKQINLTIEKTKGLTLGINPRGGGGTNDYNSLIHKPSINGVTLIGDKTSDEIHVQAKMDIITEQDIDEIIYG